MNILRSVEFTGRSKKHQDRAAREGWRGRWRAGLFRKQKRGPGYGRAGWSLYGVMH